MNWSKLLNKNLLKYISLSYLNVVLNVLINVLLLNRLTSIDFGRFSLAKTIFQSFEFSHLGIRNAFDRISRVDLAQRNIPLVNLWLVWWRRDFQIALADPHGGLGVIAGLPAKFELQAGDVAFLHGRS